MLMIGLDLQHIRLIVENLIGSNMLVSISKFQWNRITCEHIVSFLDFIGAKCYDQSLCLRQFSKSLTNCAYTWFVNLKPGYVHN